MQAVIVSKQATSHTWIAGRHVGTTETTIARRAFAEIANRFPSISMSDRHDEQIDISIQIPVQVGIKHEAWLTFDNFDELQFRVENFRLEWCPCSKPDVVEHYVDAVSGFLSGRYRILEHDSLGQCFKAQLQAPDNGEWKTIGSWGTLWLSLPWGQTTRELRNT